jgi:hypothetical protein
MKTEKSKMNADFFLKVLAITFVIVQGSFLVIGIVNVLTVLISKI